MNNDYDPDFDSREGFGVIAFGAGMVCMLAFIAFLHAVWG